jgi:hypothetical protein
MKTTGMLVPFLAALTIANQVLAQAQSLVDLGVIKINGVDVQAQKSVVAKTAKHLLEQQEST